MNEDLGILKYHQLVRSAVVGLRREIAVAVLPYVFEPVTQDLVAEVSHRINEIFRNMSIKLRVLPEDMLAELDIFPLIVRCPDTGIEICRLTVDELCASD